MKLSSGILPIETKYKEGNNPVSSSISSLRLPSFALSLFNCQTNDLRDTTRVMCMLVKNSKKKPLSNFGTSLLIDPFNYAGKSG